MSRPLSFLDSSVPNWVEEWERLARLVPSANKFHVGAKDGKHYWLTPPDLYARLDAEFAFDFDPCPYPLPAGFDGLTVPWGASNYVNPPFGSILHGGKRKGATAWVRKALAEHAQGKSTVLVYPIDKWVLMLFAAGAEVRNLGDVRWLATEDGSAGAGTGRHIAAFILRAGAKGRDCGVLESLLGPHGDLSRALAEALHLARSPAPYRGHELVTAIEGAFDALRELRRAVEVRV